MRRQGLGNLAGVLRKHDSRSMSPREMRRIFEVWCERSILGHARMLVHVAPALGTRTWHPHLAPALGTRHPHLALGPLALWHLGTLAQVTNTCEL